MGVDTKETIRRAVTEDTETLVGLSHRIHANPEVAFQETKACEWLTALLEEAGFKIEKGAAGLPTAFVARIGSGPLNIGICAEYDALPGIGHACGHNIIAAAAIGAARALAPLVDELAVTITVLGTPAEEGGGGKVLMLQRGSFDGLNAAMMVHPSRIERDAMATLAWTPYLIAYHGRSAHAAAAPQRGISASAALALAQVGIGMLREHIPDADRVHGIVVDGGDAANIIPAHTTGCWFVRSPSTQGLSALAPRTNNVFKGAAMMTGCSCEISQFAPTYSELITDVEMAAIWRLNASQLGRESVPLSPDDPAASTDMGNVSHAVPSIHPLLAVNCGEANIHEPAFADAAVGSSGDRAVTDGATAMAWTITDMAAPGPLRDLLLQKSYTVADVPPEENAYLGYDYDQKVVFKP